MLPSLLFDCSCFLFVLTKTTDQQCYNITQGIQSYFNLCVCCAVYSMLYIWKCFFLAEHHNNYANSSQWTHTVHIWKNTVKAYWALLICCSLQACIKNNNGYFGYKGNVYSTSENKKQTIKKEHKNLFPLSDSPPTVEIIGFFLCLSNKGHHFVGLNERGRLKMKPYYCQYLLCLFISNVLLEDIP